MIEQPLAIIAYTSVFGAGAGLLHMLRYQGSFVERMSLAWLAGLFLESWIFFVLGLFSIPFARAWILPADILLTAGFLVYLYRDFHLRKNDMSTFLRGGRRPTKQSDMDVAARAGGFAPARSSLRTGTEIAAAASQPRDASRIASALPGLAMTSSKWIFKVSATVFVAYFLFHFILNAEKMVYFSDAVMSYDFRGRAVAYEQTVKPVIYGWPEVITPNFFYPPLTTLFHAHYYLLGGENPKVLYTILLLALAGITYATIRRHGAGRTTAMLAACFMAFLPTSRKYSLLTLLDFPAVCYFGLGAAYFAIFLNERKWTQLFIASIGFAGVGFLRPEATFFMAGIFPILLWHLKVRRIPLHFVWLPILIYALTVGSHEYFIRIVLNVFPEAQLNFGWATLFSLRRLGDASLAFLSHFFSDRFMLCGFVVPALAFRAGKPDQEDKYYLHMIAAFCILWFGLVMVDNASDWREMRLYWSYFRIFTRISPLFILYIFRHNLVLEGFNHVFAKKGVRISAERIGL